VRWVKDHELKKLSTDPGESPLSTLLNQVLSEEYPTATDTRQIYACHLELQDYLVHREGKPFSREEYRSNPERFESTFHEKVSFEV